MVWKKFLSLRRHYPDQVRGYDLRHRPPLREERLHEDKTKIFEKTLTSPRNQRLMIYKSMSLAFSKTVSTSFTLAASIIVLPSFTTPRPFFYLPRKQLVALLHFHLLFGVRKNCLNYFNLVRMNCPFPIHSNEARSVTIRF